MNPSKLHFLINHHSDGLINGHHLYLLFSNGPMFLLFPEYHVTRVYPNTIFVYPLLPFAVGFPTCNFPLCLKYILPPLPHSVIQFSDETKLLLSLYLWWEHNFHCPSYAECALQCIHQFNLNSVV